MRVCVGVCVCVCICLYIYINIKLNTSGIVIVCRLNCLILKDSSVYLHCKFCSAMLF